jgi:hypothetical protein
LTSLTLYGWVDTIVLKAPILTMPYEARSLRLFDLDLAGENADMQVNGIVG